MDFSVKVEGLDRLSAKSKIFAEIAKKEVAAALEVSANRVRNHAVKSIQDGQKSGRTYKRGKGVIHKASAPGEAPASDSGALATRGITTQLFKDQLLATVSARMMNKNVNYAAKLEFGTPTIAPRPFLYPALNANKDWINDRMAKALDHAIAKAAKKGVESLG